MSARLSPAVRVSMPQALPGTRRPTLLESGLSLAFRMLPVKHGAHRLLDRLAPHAWVKGPCNVSVPYQGGTLQIDVSDLVGWHFLVMRNFDPEISEVLLSFAGAAGEDVFWDIGANKGALSYAIAGALPRARIVAIEPQAALREPLNANLETLARGRYEVFTVALGEEPGRLELVIPPGNRGGASLAGARDAGSLVEVVEVLTADTLRRRSAYGWPSLVKIDVEGFEPAVIRSLSGAFQSRQVRACVFECHGSEEGGFQQIRQCTEPCGYRVYAIRKTPLSTRLVPTAQLAHGATDYALIRDDLSQGGTRTLVPRRAGNCQGAASRRGAKTARVTRQGPCLPHSVPAGCRRAGLMARASLPCLALAAAAPGLAQERQFQFHIATGISFPTGTTADYLENGWIISGGVRWNPPNWGPFALQADLHYSNYDATRNFLRLADRTSASERINDGWADLWGVNFNGVYKFVLGSYAHGYLTAGIGESYRRVRLGETVLVAGTYCDPWWGFCYQAVTPGTLVSQDRSTSRFTWNVGAGAEFPLGWYGGGVSFFVEVRYQHMATTEATEIVPLQVGLRF